MSRKLSAIFVLSALAGKPVLRAEEFKQVQTSTERMDFAPGGLIRLNASYGDLYVVGWDQKAVEITVTKSMPYNYKLSHPEQASKHLERVRIRTERHSDTEVAISTIKASGVALKYEIHVPRESRLEIQHRTGYVFVNNVTGDIEASCRRGDILLMLPGAAAYAIDAKSKFGTISSDFEGSAKVTRYRLGERYITPNSSAHRLYLRMGFGGITIKAIPREAYAVPAPGSSRETDSR
jgi:hypothetical protein